MDLGLGLEDDDIFSNCQGRTKEQCTDPYSARLCPELWFSRRDISGLSNIDAQTITKYQGDMAYQDQLYDSALLTFQHCRDLLRPNNVSMRRGVEEDLARSHLRLGQLEKALGCARNVVALAQNYEQVTAVLVLLLDIYEAAGRSAEMLCTVKKLLLLHPNNSGLWTKLGDLYSSASSCSTQNYDARCPSQTDCTVINGAVGRVGPCRCSRENSRTRPNGVEVTHEGCEKPQTDNLLDEDPSPEDASAFDATRRTVCECGGRVPFGINGRIVSTENVRCLSEDHISDRFESISCDDLNCRNEVTSFRQRTRERDRLLFCLTCFVAARLLLTSVQCRLNSFAKDKNSQDQLKNHDWIRFWLSQTWWTNFKHVQNF